MKQCFMHIKGPEILESTRRVDTVVVDKTGTVTTGTMTLASVTAADGETRDEVLRVAGALESSSEHPIARAITAGARTELGEHAELLNARYSIGYAAGGS